MEHSAAIIDSETNAAKVITLRKIPQTVTVVKAALFGAVMAGSASGEAVLYLSTDLRVSRQAAFPVGAASALLLDSVFAHLSLGHGVLTAVGTAFQVHSFSISHLDLEVPGDLVFGVASGFEVAVSRVDIYYEYRRASRTESLYVARQAAVSARGATRL